MQGNGVETPRVLAWPLVLGNKCSVLPREGPALSCRVQLPGPSGFASRAKCCSAQPGAIARMADLQALRTLPSKHLRRGMQNRSLTPTHCAGQAREANRGPSDYVGHSAHPPKPPLLKLVERDQKFTSYLAASQMPHVLSGALLPPLEQRGSVGDSAFVLCSSGRSRMTNGQRQKLSSEGSLGVDHWPAMYLLTSS